MTDSVHRQWHRRLSGAVSAPAEAEFSQAGQQPASLSGHHPTKAYARQRWPQSWPPCGPSTSQLHHSFKIIESPAYHVNPTVQQQRNHGYPTVQHRLHHGRIKAKSQQSRCEISRKRKHAAHGTHAPSTRHAPVTHTSPATFQHQPCPQTLTYVGLFCCPARSLFILRVQFAP